MAQGWEEAPEGDAEADLGGLAIGASGCEASPTAWRRRVIPAAAEAEAARDLGRRTATATPGAVREDALVGTAARF